MKEKSGVFLRLFWEEVVEMLPLETIPGYDLKIWSGATSVKEKSVISYLSKKVKR